MTLRTDTAMVMAAGLGTRMRPLTDTMPKPLIRVGEKTLIDHVLDWLAASGVTRAIVNSAYKAEMLEAHIAQRQHPVIHISREPEPLETGGGIKRALPLLEKELFFSLNSDTICIDGAQPALHRLSEAWDDEVMDALLLLHKVENAIGFSGAGDFFLNDDHSVKRRQEANDAPYVFTGVQLLHARLFEQTPEGVFSLNRLYDRNRLPDGTLPRIHALVHDGKWLHVGDPAGIAQAEAALAT